MPNSLQISNGVSPIFFIIILSLLFGISFFFSLSETSLIAMNKIKLKHLVNKGVKKAKVAYKLITHMDKLITTILVGNNFINVAISVVGALICIRIFGERLGVATAPFLVTAALLICAEITPKIVALMNPDKIGMFVARPMKQIVKTLHPVVIIVTSIVNFIIRLFGGHPPKRNPLITEEEIRMMMEVGKEEGVLTDDELKMLHRIFEFGDTKASDVMVPIEHIVSIDINASPEEFINLLLEEGHSRIPVYENSKNNIKGIIYARDLIYILKEKGLIMLPELVRPAYVVNEYKRVSELLRDFQQKNIQIAMVESERVGAVGLVTLEDLIEEIVGEID